MKQAEKDLTREYLVDYTSCYVFCFCEETPDRWKKIFIEKRLETFLETKKDVFEEITGIKLNETNLKDFTKIYKELFLEEIEKYLTELKKTKDAELKEEIRKHGVKRKVDHPSDKKKKKRK